MLILVCVAVLTAVLYMMLRSRKKKAGIKGWVQSQDLDGRSRKLYQDARTGITARPDVVQSDRVIEYKSAPAKDKARRSDLLQLTAEMIAANKKVGELRYGNNRRFEFRMVTPTMRTLEGELSRISGQMIRHLRTRTAPKGIPSRKKCAKCDFQRECPDAIAS